jgi:23S rRNA (pseudouridine1915-N3)-methyltransferase
MIKIKILTIGKTKEAWLKDALAEYTERMSRTASIEWTLAKSTSQLGELLLKEPHYICLDPLGKAYSSEEFSTFLFAELIAHGARVAFVIGGPEGLSKEMIQRSAHLVSFSRLTFTHQCIRLLLLEQLYRAIEIEKGSAYHK